MPEYRVAWEIDVEAESPHDAAEKALRRLKLTNPKDPCSCAVFSVQLSAFARIHGDKTHAINVDLGLRKVRVRFHPQATVSGHDMEVDPLGDTEFDAYVDPESVPISNSYESDQLREYGPEWVRDWPGPFWVEMLDEA